jgi:succinoglycan biosynthesis protein ExoA
MSRNLISVIVPCRNERDHIEAFCQSVSLQQLPDGVCMEVLIADGMSDDGTRERFLQWQVQWLASGHQGPDAPLFAMLDNPGRIVSSGLNQCIAQSTGEFIVRLDVHTVYAPDYIAQCWVTWQQTGADNVGGPWRAEGQSGPAGVVQRAIAAAFQSRWVSGGALSRDLTYNGPVDTVYLGAWPRQTFEKVGGFDEQLVRNQDDEHNLRIHRAGGQVWQSSAICSSYVPRDRISDVFRQYRQYGYWKPFVMRKHGQVADWRHLVPAIFAGSWLLISLLLVVLASRGGGWMLPHWRGEVFSVLLCLWLLQIIGYTVAVFVLSMLVAWHNELGMLRQLPSIILAYHVGYGIGSLQGFWSVLVRGHPDPSFGQLTRRPPVV